MQMTNIVLEFDAGQRSHTKFPSETIPFETTQEPEWKFGSL